MNVLKLPRTVWILGLVSLINDAAGEMIYPIIPLFLASVLMAGPKALGLMEGIAEATSSLLKLVSGVLVDKTRQSKPLIVLGYGLANIGRPLMGLVTAWPWLLLIRVTDRIGKGLRSSPRDALLADSVSSKDRGLVFGFHRAMDNLGSMIGPLLAAGLLALQVPLKDIFLWSAIPAVLCVALTLLIKEPARAEPLHLKATATGISWQLSDMPLAYKRYLLVIALFTLGNSSNMFLLLRAKDAGLSDAQIPLLWALVSGVASVFSTPLSALSDRLGRQRLLISGYGAYALFYLGMSALGQNTWAIYGLFMFYGLFMAATEGVEKAMVADLAPADKRGTAFGWFNLVAGLFLLPASVIFGWLYESWTPQAAFLFSASCALLAALLMWRWLIPVGIDSTSQ